MFSNAEDRLAISDQFVHKDQFEVSIFLLDRLCSCPHRSLPLFLCSDYKAMCKSI